MNKLESFLNNVSIGSYRPIQFKTDKFTNLLSFLSFLVYFLFVCVCVCNITGVHLQLMALLLLRHALSITGDGEGDADEDASTFFSVSESLNNLSCL